MKINPRGLRGRGITSPKYLLGFQQTTDIVTEYRVGGKCTKKMRNDRDMGGSITPVGEQRVHVSCAGARVSLDYIADAIRSLRSFGVARAISDDVLPCVQGTRYIVSNRIKLLLAIRDVDGFYFH